MNRHLLPNEIDILLDGEVGFGTPPLKAHVRVCAECLKEVEDAKALVRSLEQIPRLAPAPLFAERVMARVQVYVPWYVSLTDVIRGFVPQSRPARLALGAGAMLVGLLLTAASLWILSRADALIFLAGVALERGRESLASAVGGALGATIGEPALHALQSAGWLGMTTAALVFLLMTAGATSLLRGLAARTRIR
ncbi:MAG: hypothetical protein H7Z74_16595 [Anaerolineae bacterium]|nr:hypothetical protein [Gemmatimonadaceae bacterium]